MDSGLKVSPRQAVGNETGRTEMVQISREDSTGEAGASVEARGETQQPADDPDVTCSKSRGDPCGHQGAPNVNSLWDETLLM
jgi:hypothetical protein